MRLWLVTLVVGLSVLSCGKINTKFTFPNFTKTQSLRNYLLGHCSFQTIVCAEYRVDVASTTDSRIETTRGKMQTSCEVDYHGSWSNEACDSSGAIATCDTKQVSGLVLVKIHMIFTAGRDEAQQNCTKYGGTFTSL